ncbi:hypothetical protein B0H67DRAFT_486666 [Lasiosphaeris hirsuta]|uniref:Nitronate monooxygenase n=1 Tax=Lasiosphaeris hirsuta TaxID=260670 RepID=A0AA40ANP4_9PEZI|nr:hypothetical protein B0H67DRAFT_486666 [Lasiosphaeris hirsuta]
MHTVKDKLVNTYPWMKPPFIVSAPMRAITGPELAVSVFRAGGLGFIGPGPDASSTATNLSTAHALLFPHDAPDPIPCRNPAFAMHETGPLPLGVGFQLWNGSLGTAAAAVECHRPRAAWLFAPRHGQPEVDAWAAALRAASPSTQIWLQIGTLAEALAAVASPHPPDVLVVQGAEAGGHGRAADGAGFVTLLPEIADAVRGSGIPLFAAGGVVDGRGVVAALGVGAAGVAMGTRFLAAREARIARGYQDEVVRARDGGRNTVRTHLWNHLRGTFGWPAEWSPRGVVNRSWVEEREGVGFDALKERHDEVVREGDKAWGPEGRTATYAGAGVGLVKEVKGAGEIMDEVRKDAFCILRDLMDSCPDPESLDNFPEREMYHCGGHSSSRETWPS